MAYRTILVPVSGIPIDEQALGFACDLARRDKAQVLAIHVIEIERARSIETEEQAQIEHAEQILDHARAVAKSTGCSLQTDLLQSRAAGPALLDQAQVRGIDLIVLGLPYRKRLGEFHVGSTAMYVLKNALCAVSLWREPAARSHAPGIEEK